MIHIGPGIKNDFLLLPYPPGQIGIFKIKEKPGIKPVHVFHDRGLYPEKAACTGVDRLRAFKSPVGHCIDPPEFSEQREFTQDDKTDIGIPFR